ncbi:MAG: hypothetical protein ACTSU4_05320 [Promethearchaeota archaeon]
MISGAIKKYPPHLTPIHVAKRFITRNPSEFEDNYSITPEQFQEMDKQAKFALKWHVYDLDYGVPAEIDDWLKKGHSVIVNVSRMIIPEARKLYKNVKVIFIEVPIELTIKRIMERGREKGKSLKKRIERAKKYQKYPEADFIVDNSKDLDHAISQFLDYIIRTIQEMVSSPSHHE